MRIVYVLALSALLVACSPLNEAPIPIGSGVQATTSTRLTPEAPASPLFDTPLNQALPKSEPTKNPVQPGAPEPPATATADLSPVAQLKLQFGTRYFSSSGQQTQLQVQLLNAEGQTLDIKAAPLQFSSSRPQDFRVDPNGVVTALVNSGFSEILVNLTGTPIQAKQLFSVSAAGEGGSSGGSSNSSGAATPDGSEEPTVPSIAFEF